MGLARRVLGGAGAVAAALVCVLAMAPPARSQNLVQNPNFTDGLNGYVTTGSVNVGDFNGTLTAVVFSPDSISQAIATSPGTLYTVVFSATYDPPIVDSLVASFGSGSFSVTPTNPGDGTFYTYDFSGTAEGTSTNLSFTATDGAFAITGLSVEAGVAGAPTPVPGSGALSILGGLSMFAIAAVCRMTGNRRLPAAGQRDFFG